MMLDVTMTAEELRSVLYATENGDDPGNLRKFSYAGGNSSYSFGLLQFDIRRNLGSARSVLDQVFPDTGDNAA